MSSKNSRRYAAFVILLIMSIGLLILSLSGVAFKFSLFLVILLGVAATTFLMFNVNTSANQTASGWQESVPVLHKFGVTDEEVDKLRYLLMQPENDDGLDDDIVEDEVVAVSRHHGIYVFFAVGQIAGAFALLGFGIFAMYSVLIGTRHKGLAILLWLSALSFVCAAMAIAVGVVLWKSRYWMVTNLRLVRVNAYPRFLSFLPDNKHSLELRNITGVDSTASIIGKQFDYGTVFVYTAGNPKREENIDWSEVRYMHSYRDIESDLTRAMARSRR